MTIQRVGVKYIGEDGQLSDELRLKINEFINQTLHQKVPEELTTEEDKLKWLVEQVNAGAKEHNYPIEAVPLDDDTMIGGLPVEIMEAIGGLISRLHGGGAKEATHDPKILGAAALEFGTNKFFQAYSGQTFGIPEVMSHLIYTNLHLLGAAIMRDIDDSIKNKEQARRIVLRIAITSMVDHYINETDKCGLLKDFGLNHEDLLADLHAVAMNKADPHIERLLEQFNTLTDRKETVKSGVLSDALH